LTATTKNAKTVKKLLTLLVALTCCSTAFAESQLYVCELPAEDGKEGCGPNNTHSTYSFLVDTRDFDDRFPYYVFQGGKGCDISKKAKFRFLYDVSPETITFKQIKHPTLPRDKWWTTITVDRQSLRGSLNEMNQSSSELTCRIEKVNK